MKRLRAIPALILALALTISSAGAYTVRYDGIDWSCEDFLATDAFRERVDQILKQAEAEGWPYEDFSYAMAMAMGEDDDERLIEEYDRRNAADDHLTAAQCEFDPATGTVLRVTNDALNLYIPARINGVEVKYIAYGAISGKEQIVSLMLPPSLEQISQPVVVNCRNFRHCNSYPGILVTSKLYENCPAADEVDLKREYTEAEIKTTPVFDSAGNQLKEQHTNLPRTLMTRLKVFQGDGTGMDWTGSLTRAQAAAVILRLMGLEEEAQAASDHPCPFTDVPDWAKGYVNLAYEKDIVKGVGNGLFDPSGRCRAQDFCLMLLRLTDYQEGKDYSWTTAVTDAQLLIRQSKRQGGASPEANYELYEQLYNNNKFTREHACAVIYRMLSVPMTDGKSSLGDILCAKYGLSTAELFCHDVYLTSAAFGDRLSGIEIPRNSQIFVSMDDSLKNKMIQTRAPVVVSEEIQTLVDRLVAGKTGDYEKAEAICTWVAQNIAYDYDTFEGRADNPQDPDSVLKNRYAVCAGFSMLTRYMMAAADIPCLYVSGWGSGGRHAWNEIYADGRWFPADNTWDCYYDYRNGAITRNDHGLPEFSGQIHRYFDESYIDFYNGHTLWANEEVLTYNLPESNFY